MSVFLDTSSVEDTDDKMVMTIEASYANDDERAHFQRLFLVAMVRLDDAVVSIRSGAVPEDVRALVEFNEWPRHEWL